MQDHNAKMKSLENLIGAMDGHMVGGAMKRKKANMPAPTPAPEAQIPEPATPEQDELDADAAKQLADMYEQDPA